MTKKRNLLSSTPAPIRLHIPAFTRVAVTQIGCGGTGSHIASGLVAIADALSERDIPMDVLLIDPDIVEEKNVGRQLFALADIGKPKAQVIAERLNAAFGTRFSALAREVAETDLFGDFTGLPLRIVIGAVDNPAARSVIAKAVSAAKDKLWWLDCGNENHNGQIALGNITNSQGLRGAVALGMINRLPAPTLVYPDLTKTPRRKRSPRSCAEATAAGEQSLMINRVVAAYACELLAAFLITREVKWFALALDLAWGGTRPYTLDVPTLSEVSGLRSDQLVAKGKR